MNKFILFSFCMLLVSSCVKEGIDAPVPAPVPDVSHFQTSEEFAVPVKDGYVTQVKLGGEIIAEAVSPMTILIPKSYETSRSSDGPQLVYVPISEYPNQVLENQARLYQVVCFEDSKAGDYDFNDLVIHVIYRTQGNRFGFGVQPVALGSTKSIKLGCAVYKGSTLLFKGLITPEGKDCREQYFQGQPGFLNTRGTIVNSESYKKSFLGSTIRNWKINQIPDQGAMHVEWYIEVDNGVELYALSTNYIDKSFDKNGMPYGLVMTNTGFQYIDKGQVCGFDWFNYPQESKMYTA